MSLKYPSMHVNDGLVYFISLTLSTDVLGVAFEIDDQPKSQTNLKLIAFPSNSKL